MGRSTPERDAEARSALRPIAGIGAAAAIPGSLAPYATDLDTIRLERSLLTADLAS